MSPTGEALRSLQGQVDSETAKTPTTAGLSDRQFHLANAQASGVGCLQPRGTLTFELPLALSLGLHMPFTTGVKRSALLAGLVDLPGEERPTACPLTLPFSPQLTSNPWEPTKLTRDSGYRNRSRGRNPDWQGEEASAQRAPS